MTFWILLPEAVVSRIHQRMCVCEGVDFGGKVELIGEFITSRQYILTKSPRMEEPPSDEFMDGEKHQGDAEDEDDQGSVMDGTGSFSSNASISQLS
jgi:hypothetical protein